MQRAVLVTGAAGFIGMHVADALLTRGERVIGLDDFNAYYDPALKRARVADLSRRHNDRFSCEAIDVADMDALALSLADAGFDRIVHLAAQPGVRHSIENPHAYARANLVGHLNVLEIARNHRVGHLVYASSSSVYGGREDTPFRVEDRADLPISLYAATKRADELMSEAYAHLYRIPQTGLRFFTVYGPWGRPDMAVWLFTEAILKNEPIVVFNHGLMERDFTYIDDIVAGVLAALDQPPADDGTVKDGGSIAPHRIWNIGNNRPEKLESLIAAIEAACGRKAILDLQPMQPGDVPVTAADISPIRRATGFEPSTTIAEGVPRFVDWYRGFYGVGEEEGIPTA